MLRCRVSAAAASSSRLAPCMRSSPLVSSSTVPPGQFHTAARRLKNQQTKQKQNKQQQHKHKHKHHHNNPSSHQQPQAAQATQTPTVTVPAAAAAAAPTAAQTQTNPTTAQTQTLDTEKKQRKDTGTNVPSSSVNPPASSSSSSAPTATAGASPSSVPPPTPASLSPLWSWGWGHLAGLGHGDYAARALPTPIASLGGVEITDISCSWGKNIAVTKGGSVIHWGWKPLTRSWITVMKIFRRAPRMVKFLQSLNWGRFTLNSAAPLLPTRLAGWGSEPGDPEPQPGQDILRAVAASAGSDFCAILSDEGQVYTFGAGFYGQLGHSSEISDTLLPMPRMVCKYQNQHPNESHGRKVESNPDLSPSFPNSPIIQVATGFSHMLILTKNGQVYACGKTDHGALGITHIYRDGKRLFLPHLIPVTDAFAAGEHGSGEPWIKVSALEAHEAQSTQFASAQNDPEIVQHYVGPMVQVCAGMKHSLFLNAGGEVYACGDNGLNELGNDTYHPSHGLIKVKLPLASAGPPSVQSRRRKRSDRAAGISTAEDTNEGFFSSAALQSEKIVKIATGMHHSLALSNYGNVYSWGSNLQGQCGVPCSVTFGSSPSFLSTRHLSRKKFGSTSSEAEIDVESSAEAAKKGHTLGAHLKKATNEERKKVIHVQCQTPTRINLEEFDLGPDIDNKKIGTVVDVQAGFYDSGQ